MVSGNSVPDFNSLSDSEKRAVAERLMKIEESGWKPFWCSDRKCDGTPHWLIEVDDQGEETNVFVDASADSGPNGEPVGEVIYESVDGEWFEATGPVATQPSEGDVCLGRPLLEAKWAHNHARKDQRLPGWLRTWVLFIMSGRGTGKTRTGVEFVALNARKGLDGAIIGRRGTELVNTHVKALIEHAHPEFRPEYLASKDILVWPEVTLQDGSKVKPTTFLFSAERPENIRSVNLSYFWMDEAAFMPEVETAWMNAKMATRIETPGNPIHILITSTPTSTPWVMKMEDDPDVEVRRVSTYANRRNLSKDFIDALRKEYEGTRMGRQELYGEVLRDVEGSLWNDDLFQHLSLDEQGFATAVDGMDDVVVAVDPAGSKGKHSDATGIMAVGTQHTDDNDQPLPVSRYFVLADATLKGSPSEWAEQVYKTAVLVKARRIVAEKNFGGDMVKQVLSDWAKLNPDKARDENGDEFRIEVVHAQKAKEIRAEGTVGKYEQGRVTHVTSPIQVGKVAAGDLSMLEKEQVTWVPKSRGGRMPSPNRIDALVWAVRALETKTQFPTMQANQRQMLAKLKRPAVRPHNGATIQTHARPRRR